MAHEMWRDEVRALSVATKAATWASMFGDLHQEGHPGLWYVLLRSAFELTHSTLVLPILALLFGAAAAYVILRYSPFPFWLRLLAIFGVFIGYEYSVMARNYGVGVLLLLTVCALFSSRDRHSIAIGVLLALAANSSVHAAIASTMIALLWASDYLDGKRRPLMTARTIAGLFVALAGVALAIWCASPSPDMSYATSLHTMGLRDVIAAVARDPASGLKGVFFADVAGAGEISWLRFSIEPMVASRIIVDLGLVAVMWGLLPSRRHLVAFILSILAFEVFFQNVYPAALRHQGIVTFLLLGICWIAIADGRNRDLDGPDSRRFANRVALGLLPIFLVQSIALPIVARRHLMHPASSSKAFAGLIERTPRLADAILVSEPDYLMEPMPFYVRNRIYFPRQREFNYRVYFDTGIHRQHDLTLGSLLDAAAGLACENRRPVLISIGYTDFRTHPSGSSQGAFRRAFRDDDFHWSAADRQRLSSTTRLIGDFQGATTDENYQVFELPPLDPAACSARP